MKFSVITPTYYNKEDKDNERQPRYEMFLRCAESLRTQVFRDFEWVVVDDICTPPVDEVLKTLDLNFPYKVIRLPEKSGRIVARNRGMEASEGEWICWLDADDEWSSLYLQAFDQASKLYTDYEMFSQNHLIFSYDYGVTVRKFIDVEKLEGRPFGSGTIGAGAYVFKKKLFDEIGGVPEKGLWDLANWAYETYPEIKPFFWNESQQNYNSLGNPWGEDYLFFYMLTRKAKCKYLDTALYYVHSHYGHRWPEDPDYLIGEGKKPEWNKNIQ